MAKRGIAANHVGSLLGFFWTFINPLLPICILWVVFSVGFKIAPANVPFAVWLTAGMAIWNILAEALNGSTGVINHTWSRKLNGFADLFIENRALRTANVELMRLELHDSQIVPEKQRSRDLRVLQNGESCELFRAQRDDGSHPSIPPRGPIRLGHW